MIYIEGIIIPADWDNKGNVVALAIATRDEKEYWITDKEQVARLKPLLRQEVKIGGTLGNKEGRRTIKINKFILLNHSTTTSINGFQTQG